MNIRVKRIAFSACIVLIGVLAWLVLRHERLQTQAAATKSQAEPRIRVHVAQPQRGGLARSLTRPASIHAFERADLYAKVSGFLQNQVVDIGSVVKKGELLAEIFAPEIEAGAEKAQAALSRAKALVNVAEARVAESKSDLVEAQAKLGQASADLDSAKALSKLREEQYDRMAKLAKLKAVEQELVDESFQSRRSTQAAEQASVKAVTTAQAGIQSAAARVTRAQADLADSQAEVQVAQAALRAASVLEAYTRIRAPFDGVIANRSFHNGDFIRDASNGGNVPLLSVADYHLMRVIVWVPDEDVPFIRKGNRASLTVFAFPDRTFQSPIARTAMSEDYNTRTMRVEFDVPNTEQLLTDGMYGSATIGMGKNPNAMTIPSACLVGDEAKKNERTVYVVRDGKAHRLTVRIGAHDGIRAEVLSGLQPADEVIQNHGLGIAEGTSVQVVSAEGHKSDTSLQSNGARF